MKLLYPEKRDISPEEVIAWARDVRVTDAMSGKTPNLDITTVWSSEHKVTKIVITVPDPTLEEAVAELTDIGDATFAAT